MSAGRTRRPRLRVPITAFLILGFGGLMMFAVAVQFYIGVTTARDNTLELLHDKAIATLDGLHWNIRATLDPVVARGRSLVRLVEQGELNSGERGGRFDAFLFGMLAASPTVETIAVMEPDGRVRTYRRDPLELVTTDRSGDPAHMALVARAAEEATPYWGEPRTVDGRIVAVHHTPVLDPEGSLRGILVQTIAVGAISQQFAGATSSDENQTPFALYGESGLVAHPLLIGGNLRIPAGQGRLPTAEEVGDGVLARIWEPDELHLENLASRPGDTVKGLSFGDRVFLFVYRVVDGYGSQRWTIGTYIDGERTRTQIRRIVFAGGAGIAMLLLALGGAVAFGRGTSRPAERLAAAAALVRRGDLDAIEPLPPSRLRELDHASASFNEMIDGLRERNVIRDLFGKVVPESVAAAMLHAPEGLQPVSCEATILFVDLAGFTALSERVEPVEIVEILNAYFTEVVDAIRREGGIITQFQGDAVLAVFNVPTPLADHATRAVAAARAIQGIVAGKTFLGHRLRCRVGVNTGQVVAGNVGASGRMNYTVHGDAVNLAARLEQLDKEHGTGILVSESTVAQVGEAGFRRLATVDIRGRTAPVTIYTPAVTG